MIDRDGLTVSPLWAQALEKWYRLPMATRLSHSRYEVEKQAKDAERAAKKAARKAPEGPVTKFSTEYAVRHGKALGWRLLEREQWKLTRLPDGSYRRQSHDLLVGSDCIFAAPEFHGLTIVQAAGLGERAAHMRRFEDRGGVERCLEIHARFLYWEFERGISKPRKEECWI